MDRIVLEVSSELAKSWRKVPAGFRRSLERELEKRIMEKIAITERSSFFLLLDNVQSKTEKKGLTQKELEKLLNEK